MKVKISSNIKIDPGRREVTQAAIGELSKSIAAVGLINPIITVHNNTLVAGLHRLEAVRQMVEVAGVAPLVDHIISGEEYTAHKPEPEIYLRAMEALGVTPENALAVENSLTGITAARRAGPGTRTLPKRGKLVG